MTAIDSPPDRAVDSALAAVADAADGHELEAAWTAGLRDQRRAADRHRILAAAGRRLGLVDDGGDDRLRRHWLKDVVEEIRLRGDQSLDQGLAPVVTAQVGEAFARAEDDLTELREAAATGDDMDDFSARSPLTAAGLCDLGRITERLRGTELTALVSDEDARLTRQLADSWAVRRRLLAAVPETLRLSRDDLLGWAAGAGAGQQFPRLLRRLIRETTQVERIEFPSGTGVATPGWDGIVECAEGNQFVPSGRSGWEVSVRQSGTDKKARADYDKRVDGVKVEQRRDMSYVAVVCAPWTKARDFETEKRSLGDFRSVRALNVDALEDWLECAPSTTLWLRELTGKPVAGVSLLSAWWEKWLLSTSPPLEEGVVLAGRDSQAETLRDRCRRPTGGVITIGGQVHRDEIIAFVAAALVPTSDSGPSLGDAMYVDDHDAAEHLLAVQALSVSRPLTIVVPSADFATHLPAGSRHRMIVPIPGGSQGEIRLQAADSAVVAERLRAIDVDRDDSHELGGLARMSLMALRRHLAVNPEMHRPRWATGSVEKILRRSLLLHSWDQSRDGDRETVERFVGHMHDEVDETLSRLGSGDAPMILTGDVRHVVSPADAWMLLNHQLTPADIEAFGEIAHQVLTEPDPLNGMTGLERMQAQYDGVRAKHSSWIKRGAATTLALLGSRPPTPCGAISPASSAASGIVWRVLRSAGEDASPRTWNVVAEVLPLLAEADPEAVLSSLRSCLAERHAFADAMFADHSSEDFGFPLPSPHLRVLEALELLAWSPEHLAATADVLASLAAIDPGGQWSNRPAGSLTSIMCPWKPNTCATADERLKVVETLRRRHGPVAWELMLTMLPSNHGIQMHRRGPLYRGWKYTEPVVTLAEHADVVAWVAEALIEDVGDDQDRWVSLIEQMTGLPKSALSEIITALGRVVDASPDEEFKTRVWPVLNGLVNRHRQFHHTHWALAEAELAPFDPLLERLRPTAHAVSCGQLFSSGLRFIDGVSALDDREAYEEALSTRQSEAIGEVLRSGGVSAVLDLAMAVEQPRLVGIALARHGADFDDKLLDAMHDPPAAVTSVALGYFHHRFADLGWEGIDRLLVDHDVSPQVEADLHRAVPRSQASWTRIDERGTEVADSYWARAHYFDIGVPSELGDLLTVSRRLRQAGRTDLARTFLAAPATAHESDPEFAEEVAACLEQWIQQETASEPVEGVIVAWELTSLIRVLGKHRNDLGIERVARIEWLYYPLLQHDSEFHASSLYKWMAQNSDFFTWLVELAYKPASAPPSAQAEPTEASRLMALNAFNVLDSWPASSFVPGLDANGRVDADSINRWIDAARERLAEIDRSEIGHTKIGTALAASPADPDGKWPSVAVRDLIERLRSDSLENGLVVAMRNQRGGTWRSLTGGGDQERDLAAGYRHQSRELSQWPRTAAVFVSLAQSYEREAELHDRDAEARRRGLPL